MRSVTVLALGSFFAVSAAAQYAEIGITGGYSRFREGEIGSFGSFGGVVDTYELGNGIRIGGRMSFDFRGFFAHEIAYSWQRAKLRIATDDPISGTFTSGEIGTSSIHNYYYNFVAHATRRDSRIRPFVTGGGGMSSFVPPGYSALSGGGDTKFGYNYGAGVKFLLSDRYGIRLDVRDHVTGKPFFRDVPGRLHNVETSATFSFLF
jgi:opacity protein-like surface antigen